MNRKNARWKLLKNIVAVLAMTMVPFQLLMYLEQKIRQPYFFSIALVTGIFLVFCSLRLTGRPERLSFHGGRTVRYLGMGWYLLAVSFALGILNFFSISLETSPTFWEGLRFLAETALVAAFEELLFRGVIQNKILDFCKEEQKSVWRGICISSLIFAFMHLLNLIGKPYFLVGTLTQVIYTFSMGILIGCVYWRSENIWTAFFFHLIFNLFGSYGTLFSTEAQVARDLTLTGAAIQVILVLPCIFFARRIYRKDAR